MIRKPIFWILATVALYVSLYLLNTMNGAYRLYFVSSIHHPIDDEMDILDNKSLGAMTWQPRYGYFTRLS